MTEVRFGYEKKNLFKSLQNSNYKINNNKEVLQVVITSVNYL